MRPIGRGDHPALLGDIAFYFDLARGAGGEALEIGVGTGRVAVELAKAGIHVTGVDLSAAMLAIGAEKAAALELADRLRLECVDMHEITTRPSPIPNREMVSGDASLCRCAIGADVAVSGAVFHFEDPPNRGLLHHCGRGSGCTVTRWLSEPDSKLRVAE
jgi:SAM-dependent methyltransferase